MAALDTSIPFREGSAAFESGVAARIQRIQPLIRPSPQPGYEHVKGFGIYSLPFDSGHVLALRIFPENDFAPYATVWHRTPDGSWSIYVDGPRQDTACPRYYSAAVDLVKSANISLTWLGPMELHVTMDAPLLDLTVRMEEPPRARVMNAIGERVPSSLWRIPRMSWLFAQLADMVFDSGDVTLSGTAPNGQQAYLMPRRMYPITSATAILDDEDLGAAVRSEHSPTLGTVAFPARGMLAIGEAYFEILDTAEYERIRSELNRQ